MKIAINIFISSILMLMVVCNSFASPVKVNPPFSATCEDVVIHAYREGTDMLGKPMIESWTTNEHLDDQWRFIYTGGKSIIMDGKKLNIIVQHPGVIIVGSSSTNGYASSLWTYAIHLGLKKVVGSEVNAFGTYDDKGLGVKARAINMKCEFEIHKAPN